jgi:NitT/TauT family transport system substrate-binding protein
MVVSRRDLLLGTCALAVGACARPSGAPGVVRVASMGNLTHAPVMAGLTSGRIAASVAPLRIEARTLGAGPRVVEALLGGSVDIGVAGPAAIVAAQALHGPVLRIVAGVCSGGASLVLREGVSIEALGGKTLATPQLGSTQDVSLRKLLRSRGRGYLEHGDVRITQLAAPLAKVEMARGALDGAWLPEPWATRVVAETGAYRAIDERDLWPRRTFASSVVVARTAFLQARRADVARFLQALAHEVTVADPGESREALSQATHARWSVAVWAEAWERVSFTSDPMCEPIATFAHDVGDLGLLRTPVDVATLFA